MFHKTKKGVIFIQPYDLEIDQKRRLEEEVAENRLPHEI